MDKENKGGSENMEQLNVGRPILCNFSIYLVNIYLKISKTRVTGISLLNNRFLQKGLSFQNSKYRFELYRKFIFSKRKI